MAITKRVQQELLEAKPTAAASLGAATRRPTANALRRRRKTTYEQTEPQKLTKAQREAAAEKSKGKAWTVEEHARFLEALERFPAGPWKAIANFVGTKNSRQTMTHAQKCREKHERKTRVKRKKAASKKTKTRRSSTRQQPRRRRPSSSASEAVARRTRQSAQWDDEESDLGAATDQEEEMELHEEMDDNENIQHCFSSQTESKEDDMEKSSPIMLDEETFFSGCDDALTATTSLGSPPFLSLLSLQDPAMLSSDDLWHTQSLAEVALGVGRHGDDRSATTDLDELAVGLSQECW